eukprot:m.332568 g.332568  ORF g.332568 m.332568 type:complete len:60 (-) comp16960_c0_seq1:18-197(-)
MVELLQWDIRPVQVDLESWDIWHTNFSEQEKGLRSEVRALAVVKGLLSLLKEFNKSSIK